MNLPLPSNTVTEQQAAQSVWSKRKKKLASRHACAGLIQKTPPGVGGKSLKVILMDDNSGLFGNPNAARCLVYGIELLVVRLRGICHLKPTELGEPSNYSPPRCYLPERSWRCAVQRPHHCGSGASWSCWVVPPRATVPLCCSCSCQNTLE